MWNDHQVPALPPWTPKVVGRQKLDQHCWILAIEAPCETACNVPNLIGQEAYVEGSAFEIRGTIPNMPPKPVMKGEIIALIVCECAVREQGNPFSEPR